MTSTLNKTAESPRTESRLLDIYRNTKYLSIKHSSYFNVYERLFTAYVGKPITFVEIGILNGGSLFMWREFFGSHARIIGVDLNPAAKKWQDHGFEVFIGDQADPAFWETFFSQVGPVDILLDDGGHTNKQQIVTLTKALPHIRDGGLIVVEDTHASYFTEFGNPYKYSFIEFAKRVVDQINARASRVPPALKNLETGIASVAFFDSIVAFHIDRELCVSSIPATNNGISSNAEDFRYDKSWAADLVSTLDEQLSNKPVLWRLRAYLPRLLWLKGRLESWRMRALFK